MSYLGLLPVALVLVSASSFCFSYIIAVVQGDVSAAFPYISDTGAEVPESCIFGLLLNLTGFISFCTMYVRYKAVQAIAATEDPWLKKMNMATFILGIVSSVGCTIVANFQEGTVVEPVHIVGAFLTFVGGIVYCFMQTAISYHLYPDYNGLHICRIRLTISVISFSCLAATIIAASVAKNEWNTDKSPNKDRFKWKPDEPGFSAHVVSTVGEWLTALTFLGFFFTYVREFHKFDLEIHTRPLVRHLDEEPIRGFPSEHTPLIG